MNLNAVFDFVLTSTVNGTIVGFIIFLTRKLTGRIIPHKFTVLLWAVFIAKLFFPYGPESELSVFNLEYSPAEYNIEEIFLENISESANPNIKTVNILSYIWLFGFMLTGLWLLLSNMILSIKLKAQSKPIDERIINVFEGCKHRLNINREIRLVNQCTIIGVSLFGLLRPKVLMTDRLKNFTDREIEYIFYHELSHYTRRDIFTSYLISLIQTIHWFNPLIHVFAKVIRQDIELATDEKTLYLIENGEFKAYGLTLVSMLEEYSSSFSPKLLGVADGKRHIKERIRQISHYRKKGKYSVCLFSVLAIVLSFATLTTAVSVEPTNIPRLNIEVAEKVQTVMPKPEESRKEAPVKAETPKIQKEQAPIVSEKESGNFDEPMPPKDNSFPEAKANALLPGTDFDMMLKSILATGKNREYSHNVSLNISCAVREFNINENGMVSLGNYTPDYNGSISFYINSSSSQRLNIILLKNGDALLNASVKPSKTNSYSFIGLDKNDSYELILTYKADNEYNNTDISGTVLIY